MALPAINDARDRFMANRPASLSMVQHGLDDANEPYMLRIKVNAVLQIVIADIRGQYSQPLTVGETLAWGNGVAAAVQAALGW